MKPHSGTPVSASPLFIRKHHECQRASLVTSGPSSQDRMTHIRVSTPPALGLYCTVPRPVPVMWRMEGFGIDGQTQEDMCHWRLTSRQDLLATSPLVPGFTPSTVSLRAMVSQWDEFRKWDSLAVG